MIVLIPSLKRPMREQQRTAEQLKAAGVEFLIARSVGDDTEYPTDYPQTFLTQKGICDTRQALVEIYGDEKICMMDDDLRLYTADPDDSEKYSRATPEQVAEMIKTLDTMLDTYVLAGVAPRFVARNLTRPTHANTKIYHVSAVNLSLLDQRGDFGWRPSYRLRVGEDHDFALQLITRGHDVAVTSLYAHDDNERAPGGCSEWRDLAMDSECAHELERLWPGVVTVKTDDAGIARPRISFKKASERGRVWKSTVREAVDQETTDPDGEDSGVRMAREGVE